MEGAGPWIVQPTAPQQPCQPLLPVGVGQEWAPGRELVLTCTSGHLCARLCLPGVTSQLHLSREWAVQLLVLPCKTPGAQTPRDTEQAQPLRWVLHTVLHADSRAVGGIPGPGTREGGARGAGHSAGPGIPERLEG